jgi:leader peptidase (prepilin peptidase) / N-methyltransferase
MPVDNEAVQFLGFYAALCVVCCALALIDLRRGIIPDGLNLAIAVLGVAQAMAFGNLTDGLEALGEAAAVAVIFLLLRRLYFVLRQTEGLGLGDVKFLAAAATWVGITGIPTLLLIAALTALAAAGGLQLAGRQMKRQTSMPFGPFLALGLLLTPAFQRWLGLN